MLACNQKRIYLCWVCIIWKLQCQANPHCWLALTQSIIHYCLFFFLNNTSMYEKHISWKQWSSLKTYSTFHKPNKPAPARARKRKVGWHGKLIEMYWKGYPEYLHTYTSQGYRGLKLCKNHFPRVYKNVLLVISTLTHRGRKQTNHRRVNRLVLVP